LKHKFKIWLLLFVLFFAGCTERTEPQELVIENKPQQTPQPDHPETVRSAAEAVETVERVEESQDEPEAESIDPPKVDAQLNEIVFDDVGPNDLMRELPNNMNQGGSDEDGVCADADKNSFTIIDEDYTEDLARVYYRCQPITGADPTSFKIIGRGYATDNSGIFFRNQQIEEADLNSFVLDRSSLQCDVPYARDKNSAFLGLQKIDQSDGESFMVLGCRYGKDKNNVYYFGEILPNRDAQSFQLLGEGEAANYYSRDKNAVYYWNMPVPGADPQTIEQMYTGIHAKDNNNVYYLGKPITGADPTTFEVIELELVQEYAHDKYIHGKDAQNVYREYRKLEGADPNTFRVLSEYFTKDRNKVWYLWSEVTALDAATFEMLNPVYAKDKNNVYIDVYEMDTENLLLISSGSGFDVRMNTGSGVLGIMAEADVETFEPIARFYAKDKNYGFYRGNAIKQSDAATFRFNEEERLAEDKNGLFYLAE
jgi:hypothetical protein